VKELEYILPSIFCASSAKTWIVITVVQLGNGGQSKFRAIMVFLKIRMAFLVRIRVE
jgi:hypothetical protein